MFWQQVRPFSAQLDTALNATFCSTGTGNILIFTSHRGPGSSPSPWVSGQLTPTSPAFKCARLPLSGLASHTRGAQHWLGRQRCEMEFGMFLFLDLADHPHSPPSSPHSLSPDSVGKRPVSSAELLLYLVFGIRSKTEATLLHCRCTRHHDWAVMCRSWELVIRGFNSVTHSGWPYTLKGGLRWPPILMVPHTDDGGLWGTQLLCEQLLGHGKYKTTQKGHFLRKSQHFS